MYYNKVFFFRVCLFIKSIWRERINLGCSAMTPECFAFRNASKNQDCHLVQSFKICFFEVKFFLGLVFEFADLSYNYSTVHINFDF